MFLRAELRCCHALVTRQCNSSSLFLECLLMTPQKKKNKKNHYPESEYESAGEVVLGRLVCYTLTGLCVSGQLPLIGFTVKIVSCTAALCNNISVRFKIFLPETEGILLDNVRKGVLCVNFFNIKWKAPRMAN